MSTPITITAIEQLEQFRNEKGIIEIAVRTRNKKFRTFQKVLIDSIPESQEKELAQKVVQALNANTKMCERNLKLLSNVAKVQKIGMLLNGLNLCATCVGFAIMYAKLDSMSNEINQKLNELQQNVKQSQDVQNDYEFNKVLALHTDMLDCQRKKQPYSEAKMRDLVDREYNVLMLLIKSFQQDISSDHDALIFCIFSLLAMFTVSLRSFDEIYYFNNSQVLGDDEPWHLSHSKWMGVYDILSSEWFVEKVQDYGTFETKLNTLGVDMYYISLLDQVNDLREEVQDNQVLIIALGDAELFRQYRELSEKEIADTIEATFREAGKDMSEDVVKQAYQNAMKQAAMA